TFAGGVTMPLALDEERTQMKKKTLAEICQEQLKARPWRDPAKEASRAVEEAQEAQEQEQEKDEVNEDGTIRKKKKIRRSEKWMRENLACHVCKYRDPLWKLAVCKCGTPFCYGSLWRAFDLMPQTVMEDPDWKCPRCLKICTCAACQKDTQNKPYEPNGTV